MNKDIFKAQCNEIWQQIGGNKLKVMTGAKNLSYNSSKIHPNISFSLPKYNHTKINFISVDLNGRDLYDVKFSRFYGNKFTVIKEVNDIYCDQLREIFERETGLATRL